jgi:hypothetical protein
LLLSGLVTMAGCGEATDTVVVRIGTHSITKSALVHWTEIEAISVYEPYPHRRVPKGVVPDPPQYASCIAYLRAKGSQSTTTTAQLRDQCREQHSVLQRQILEILISAYWLNSEATHLGVGVTTAEVKRVLDEKFTTKAALHRFLKLRGETKADEELLVKRQMLASRVVEAVERPEASRPQRQRAVAAFFRKFAQKWTARTDCRVGYVVSECRQYQTRNP